MSSSIRSSASHSTSARQPRQTIPPTNHPNKSSTIQGPQSFCNEEIARLQRMIEECEDYLGLVSVTGVQHAPLCTTMRRSTLNVPGPRTDAHYLAAIRMILNLRQELFKENQLVGFWKGRARDRSNNGTVLSPSTSISSSIPPSDSEEQGVAQLCDTNVPWNSQDICNNTSDSDSEAGLRSSDSSGSPGSFGDCVGNEDQDYILRRMNFRSLDYSEGSSSDLDSDTNEIPASQGAPGYLASVVSPESPTVPRYHNPMTAVGSTTRLQDTRAATASLEDVCSSLASRAFRSLSDIAEGTEPPSSDDEEIQSDTSSHASLRSNDDSDVTEVHPDSVQLSDPDTSYDSAASEDQQDTDASRAVLNRNKDPAHRRSRLPVFTQAIPEPARRIKSSAPRTSATCKDQKPKPKFHEPSRLSSLKTPSNRSLPSGPRPNPPGLASPVQGRPHPILIPSDQVLSRRSRAATVSGSSHQKKAANASAPRLTWNKNLPIHSTLAGSGPSKLKDISRDQREDGKQVIVSKSDAVKKKAGIIQTDTGKHIGPRSSQKENFGVATKNCTRT